MEQTKIPELQEFSDLMSKIQTESDLLQNMILSEEDMKEENKILNKFDKAIGTQAISTLNNLVLYQLYGWRELIDE